MIKKNYKKTLVWIERNRFKMLLISTILVLVLPAFSGSGLLSEILFYIAISFLFIQSMNTVDSKKSHRRLIQTIVIGLILLAWLKPLGIDSVFANVLKLLAFGIFFFFVIIYLFKFIRSSATVDRNVLLTSVNIYLLIGIIGANLAYIFYYIFPNAYNFPASIDNPNFVHFLYYSFITLSTVGYGDITPRITETMTLSYFISIIGQLYMAVVIAFLLGKFLMESNQKKQE